MSSESASQSRQKTKPGNLFRLTLNQTPHQGEAQSIFIVAKTENEARFLVSQLYKTDEIPQRLQKSAHALYDIEATMWRGKKFSTCVQLRETNQPSGIISIEIRKK